MSDVTPTRRREGGRPRRSGGQGLRQRPEGEGREADDTEMPGLDAAGKPQRKAGPRAGVELARPLQGVW